MGNVQHISGNEIASDKGVNEFCIECLEQMLKQAKDGEIVGLVAAVQYADGSTAAQSGGFIYKSRIAGELTFHIQRLGQEYI